MSIEIEFQNYKARSKKELIRARELAARDIVLDLVDLVDDLNNALEHLEDPGIEQLRNRTIKRFEDAGFRSFGKITDVFDPDLHMAVSTQESDLPDGQIILCHQLGWVNIETEEIIREASVTVSKSEKREEVEQQTETKGEEVEQQTDFESEVKQQTEIKREAVEQHEVEAEDPQEYVCPVNSPGCNADCPVCILAGGRS